MTIEELMQALQSLVEIHGDHALQWAVVTPEGTVETVWSKARESKVELSK